MTTTKTAENSTKAVETVKENKSSKCEVMTAQALTEGKKP